jgi:hypothetical protein
MATSGAMKHCDSATAVGMDQDACDTRVTSPILRPMMVMKNPARVAETETQRQKGEMMGGTRVLSARSGRRMRARTDADADGGAQRLGHSLEEHGAQAGEGEKEVDLCGKGNPR